jgi:hypothetical protein
MPIVTIGVVGTARLYNRSAGARIIGHFESFRRAVLFCSIIKVDIGSLLAYEYVQVGLLYV